MMFSHFKRGFTLLEVMVAVAILALITLMLERVFSTAITAIRRGTDRILLDKTARIILDHFEEDISQALVRTNVAFRTYDFNEANENSTLYFITASRGNVYRTFQPIRFRISQDSVPANRNDLFQDWNVFFRKDMPSGLGGSTNQVDNVIRICDIYYDRAERIRRDFDTIHPLSNNRFKGGWNISTQSKYYTASVGKEKRPYGSVKHLQTGVRSTACLSFVFFAINGDPDGNRSNGSSFKGSHPGRAPFGIYRNTVELTENMPKFVDITLGLIASRDLEMAMRIRAGGNLERAKEYIDDHEKIYTRRVYIRNRGALLP